MVVVLIAVVVIIAVQNQKLKAFAAVTTNIVSHTVRLFESTLCKAELHAV